VQPQQQLQDETRHNQAHTQDLPQQQQQQQPQPQSVNDGVHPAIVTFLMKMPEDYLFDLVRGCIATLHASLEVMTDPLVCVRASIVWQPTACIAADKESDSLAIALVFCVAVRIVMASMSCICTCVLAMFVSMPVVSGRIACI
jgi:hypothetical protein